MRDPLRFIIHSLLLLTLLLAASCAGSDVCTSDKDCQTGQACELSNGTCRTPKDTHGEQPEDVVGKSNVDTTDLDPLPNDVGGSSLTCIQYPTTNTTITQGSHGSTKAIDIDCAVGDTIINPFPAKARVTEVVIRYSGNQCYLNYNDYKAKCEAKQACNNLIRVQASVAGVTWTASILHIQGTTLKKGDEIAAFGTIATCGNTGWVCSLGGDGSHVHLTLKREANSSTSYVYPGTLLSETCKAIQTPNACQTATSTTCGNTGICLEGRCVDSFSKEGIAKIFDRVGKEEDIPSCLLKAMGEVESNWDQRASDPKGGKGVMQLTGQSKIDALAKQLGVSPSYLVENSMRGIYFNVKAAAKFMNNLVDQSKNTAVPLIFQGEPRDKIETWWFVVTAYNGGGIDGKLTTSNYPYRVFARFRNSSTGHVPSIPIDMKSFPPKQSYREATSQEKINYECIRTDKDLQPSVPDDGKCYIRIYEPFEVNKLQKTHACSGTSDCSPGLKRCSNGECTACCNNEDCKSSQACRGGKCVGGCETHKDCQGMFACLNGQCSTLQCIPEYQLCKNACILDSQCCANEDCTSGKQCQSGKCVSGCPNNQTSCDSQCVDTQTSAKHCGACNKACNNGQSCISGQCQCPSGQKDCGGTCAQCCSNSDCVGTQVCQKGICNGDCRTDDDCKGSFACINNQCSTQTCRSGYKMCNSQCIPNNRCCTDKDCLNNFACVGNQCSTTKCTTSYKLCKQVCIQISQCCSDQDCSTDKKCESGGCVARCPSQQTWCVSQCVNLQSSQTHCGSCKKACKTGFSCKGGQCQCPAGQKDCNGVCSQCCANNDCGGTQVCQSGFCKGNCRSDNDCRSNFACVSNQCSTSTCKTGFRLCSGRCIANNGCCVDKDCNNNFACLSNQCSTNTCKAGYKICKGQCILSDGCCSDSDCSSNFACVGNQCSTTTCRSGYKTCNGQCILSSGCCSDSDCNNYFACSNNQCSTNTCRSGYKICNSRCIPSSGCCVDRDCSAGEFCHDYGSGQRCQKLVELSRWHCNWSSPQNNDWEHILSTSQPNYSGYYNGKYISSCPGGYKADGRKIWVYPLQLGNSSVVRVKNKNNYPVARLDECRNSSSTWTAYTIDGSSEHRSLSRSSQWTCKHVGFVITSSSVASLVSARSIYRHNLDSYKTHMWSSVSYECCNVTGSLAFWTLRATP